jgi:hypothetical protein
MLKAFKNIAKQYFQDFWQQLFFTLLKTPGTLNLLGTSLDENISKFTENIDKHDKPSAWYSCLFCNISSI